MPMRDLSLLSLARPSSSSAAKVGESDSEVHARALRLVLISIKQQYAVMRDAMSDVNLSGRKFYKVVRMVVNGSSAEDRLWKVKQILTLLWTVLLAACTGEGDVVSESELENDIDSEVSDGIRPHVKRLQHAVHVAKIWAASPKIRRNEEEFELAISCLLRGSTELDPRGAEGGLSVKDELSLQKEVQKLQLRAVKSGKRATTAKWTNVINKVSQAITDDLQAILRDEDIDFVKPEDLEWDESGFLGEGFYGRVFVGQLHFKDVAVKQLCARSTQECRRFDTDDADRRGASDEVDKHAIVRKLAKEVRALKGMRHENVLSLQGICLDPPLLITELCQLGSLNDVITNYRAACDREVGIENGTPAWELLPFEFQQMVCMLTTWRGRIKVALDAAMGMHYLHNKNVLHNDLKSPNLLLNMYCICKVADFGLAKSLAATRFQLAPELVANNPLWQAPEVMHDPTAASKASDVFSFSVIMWELLMLNRPWPHLRPKDTVAVVFLVGELGQRPKIPEDLLEIPAGGTRGLLPAEKRLPAVDRYVELMQRCWAQEPGDRPAFREIVKTLQGISKDIDAELALSDGVRRSMSLMHDALLGNGYASTTSGGAASMRSSETGAIDSVLSHRLSDIGDELGADSSDEEAPCPVFTSMNARRSAALEQAAARASASVAGNTQDEAAAATAPGGSGTGSGVVPEGMPDMLSIYTAATSGSTAHLAGANGGSGSMPAAAAAAAAISDAAGPSLTREQQAAALRPARDSGPHIPGTSGTRSPFERPIHAPQAH